MKKAKIIFFKCIYDSQEFGSDDEYLVSRVFFNLEYDGIASDSFAQVKQPAGSSCNEKFIEVSFPDRIPDYFNLDNLTDAVKAYYMRLVGARGCFIKVGDSSISARIQTMNKSYLMTHEEQFNVC